MTGRLSERFDYTAVEEDEISAAIAHSRLRTSQVAIVCGRAEDYVSGETFDAVLAFEVLEHIQDDDFSLRQWFGWLNHNGILVLSVPAKMSMYGAWDASVGHYRRYERAEIESKLTVAGFVSIQIFSYGWPIGYALEWGRRRFATGSNGSTPEQETVSSARRLQPPKFIGPLTWLFALPFRALQSVAYRTNLGTSLVVVARRDYDDAE